MIIYPFQSENFVIYSPCEKDNARAITATDHGFAGATGAGLHAARCTIAEGKVSSISQTRTLEEMAEFWDTHSLADFDDQTYEVAMTFDPSARRSVVGIETELMAEIRRIAKERQVSTQTLVNVWLRQRVDQMTSQPAAAH
jgi:hypothetical protein